MVRPDVELRAGVARRPEVLAEAKDAAQEREWSDAPLLRCSVRRCERRRPARDDDVVRVNAVDGIGEGIEHLPVQGR